MPDTCYLPSPHLSRSYETSNSWYTFWHIVEAVAYTMCLCSTYLWRLFHLQRTCVLQGFCWPPNQVIDQWMVQHGGSTNPFFCTKSLVTTSSIICLRYCPSHWCHILILFLLSQERHCNSAAICNMWKVGMNLTYEWDWYIQSVYWRQAHTFMPPFDCSKIEEFIKHPMT